MGVWAVAAKARNSGSQDTIFTMVELRVGSSERGRAGRRAVGSRIDIGI
jgi:hypothetical protein